MVASRIAHLAVLFAGGLCFVPAQSVVAHPQLTTSVRHRTAIDVSQKNVDVTIELTVGDVPAFAERLLMDNNQDGTIEASEVENYLDEQAEALQQAVTLSIANQVVELLFLYDPEIDLGMEDTSLASQLIFRLFYFARLPSGLQAGDEIVLEDRLWSHAPSLASYHTSGSDGVEFVAEKTASILSSTLGAERPLVMRIRCLAAPRDPGDGNLESTTATASDVESKPPGTHSDSVAPADFDDLSIERTQQKPSTIRPPVGWLVGLGAAALLASATVLLTRRSYRSREET